MPSRLDLTPELDTTKLLTRLYDPTQVRVRKSLYDPLSITCLYGLEAMLRVMLGKSDFDNG
jgi:hypothetical protein